MLKKKVLEKIIAQVTETLKTVRMSAESAHTAATSEENKPENEYDTRAVEAGYLAGAQSARVLELEKLLVIFQSLYSSLTKSTAAKMATAQIGALVEVQSEDGPKNLYLITTTGGGTSVQVDGRNILVLTTKSPLGEAVLDRSPRDHFSAEIRGVLKEYELLSVE